MFFVFIKQTTTYVLRICDWSSDVFSAGLLRQAKPLGNSEVTRAEIQPGNFCIVGGQLADVAASSDAFTTQYERADRRVRVIYDNATEATVLSRSFQKSLYRDETARRVSEQSPGPLFGDTAEPDEIGRAHV